MFQVEARVVGVGHADTAVHLDHLVGGQVQHVAGLGLGDALRAVGGLAHDLEVLGAVEQQLQSGTHEGLVVDQDLRWELLIGLVAAGRAGEDEIAAEESRDLTTTGRERAAQARASVPTAEAKAEAWRQVVDGTLSNTTQRNVLTGFARTNDPALLAGFAPQFFEGIEQLWASRSHEMAERAAEGLFPTAQVSQATVDAADALIERTVVELQRIARRRAEGQGEREREGEAADGGTTQGHGHRGL